MKLTGHGDANYSVFYSVEGKHLGLRLRDLDRPYSSWAVLDDGPWASPELSVLEAIRFDPALRSDIRVATRAEITRLRNLDEHASDHAAARLFGELEIERAACGRAFVADPFVLADLLRTSAEREPDGSFSLEAIVGGHRPSAPQIETLDAILSDIRNRWDAPATFVVEGASDYETSYVQGIVVGDDFYAEAVDHDAQDGAELAPQARGLLLRQGWEDPNADPTHRYNGRTDNLLCEGRLADESDVRELSNRLATSLALGYGVNPSAELLVTVFRSELE